MTVDRETSWGIQRVNPKILGGVSAGNERSRSRGLLSLLSKGKPKTEASELDPTTQDFYTQAGPTVSIEQASHTELDLKDVLDGRQVADNLGWASEGTIGLKPCDLLEKQKNGKKKRRGLFG